MGYCHIIHIVIMFDAVISAFKFSPSTKQATTFNGAIFPNILLWLEKLMRYFFPFLMRVNRRDECKCKTLKNYINQWKMGEEDWLIWRRWSIFGSRLTWTNTWKSYDFLVNYYLLYVFIRSKKRKKGISLQIL